MKSQAFYFLWRNSIISAQPALHLPFILSYLKVFDHVANFALVLVAANNHTGPLPPSVEEAYRRKCIELKRRMAEVEESNDAFRLRKARATRGIRKMRLERAYLLETLGKRMKKAGSTNEGMQGYYDEESEGSSEGPPTVGLSSSKHYISQSNHHC